MGLSSLVRDVVACCRSGSDYNVREESKIMDIKKLFKLGATPMKGLWSGMSFIILALNTKML